MIFANPPVRDFPEHCCAHAQDTAKENANQQIEKVSGTGLPHRLDGRGQQVDVGLLRLTFETALRQALRHRIQIPLRRRHVVLQNGDLITFVGQVQHALFLRL